MGSKIEKSGFLKNLVSCSLHKLVPVDSTFQGYCFCDVVYSPTTMRRTLFMTVKKARRKRHVKDILGWVDSSQTTSDTSVTGSSATDPISLHTDTESEYKHHMETVKNAWRWLVHEYTYTMYYLMPTSWPVRTIHSRETWMKSSNSLFWPWTKYKLAPCKLCIFNFVMWWIHLRGKWYKYCWMNKRFIFGLPISSRWKTGIYKSDEMWGKAQFRGIFEHFTPATQNKLHDQHLCKHILMIREHLCTVATRLLHYFYYFNSVIKDSVSCFVEHNNNNDVWMYQ